MANPGNSDLRTINHINWECGLSSQENFFSLLRNLSFNQDLSCGNLPACSFDSVWNDESLGAGFKINKIKKKKIKPIVTDLSPVWQQTSHRRLFPLVKVEIRCACSVLKLLSLSEEQCRTAPARGSSVLFEGTAVKSQHGLKLAVKSRL